MIEKVQSCRKSKKLPKILKVAEKLQSNLCQTLGDGGSLQMFPTRSISVATDDFLSCFLPTISTGDSNQEKSEFKDLS